MDRGSMESVAKGRVKLKRAYEQTSVDDGIRVLVDRLWPRGLSKSEVAIDHWAKDLSPSTELRKWFRHDPERWEEFRRRYTIELKNNNHAIDRVRELMREGTVTLVFGASDKDHNEAVVLRDLLLKSPS